MSKRQSSLIKRSRHYIGNFYLLIFTFCHTNFISHSHSLDQYGSDKHRCLHTL